MSGPWSTIDTLPASPVGNDGFALPARNPPALKGFAEGTAAEGVGVITVADEPALLPDEVLSEAQAEIELAMRAPANARESRITTGPYLAWIIAYVKPRISGCCRVAVFAIVSGRLQSPIAEQALASRASENLLTPSFRAATSRFHKSFCDVAESAGQVAFVVGGGCLNSGYEQ